jgi:hypothetical protein
MTYTSLDSLVRSLRVILPAPRDTWRLVKDPVKGQIVGLFNYRGFTLATNGIMVLIVDELNVPRFGHLQWFEPDEDEANVELSDLWDSGQSPKVASTKRSKVMRSIADYINL